jgi:hypothetical protein
VPLVKYAIFLVSLFLGLAFADEWKVFSIPSPVYSSIAYDSGTVYATEGGIQFVTPRVNRVYTAADGLGATSFYAVAQTDSKIYGVSEYGLIAAYDKGTGRWEVVNRSYLNNNICAVPGQAVAAGNVLVVAFEDRIGFFQTDKSAFLLSIEKIGDYSLTTKPPQKLLVHGDSLYVSLGDVSYERKMDWENLSKDMRLADPSSWKKRKSAFPASPSQKAAARDSVINNFTLGRAYNFTPVSKGGVVAASPEGWMDYSDGYSWRGMVPIWNGLGNPTEAYDYRMKILSATGDGILLSHVWGMGLFLFGDDGYSIIREFTPRDDNSCLDEYIEDYTVAVGTTVTPDSSGFLVATSEKSRYGLVYISKYGDISCAKAVGTTPLAGPLTAKLDSATGEWLVYVSSREEAVASLTGSLDLLRVTPPSQNGGRLVVSQKKNYPTPEGKTPVDFAFDKDAGNLWMITVGNLAYMDEDRDTLIQPQSTKGLMGAEYTSIDRDVQGNIWLGSSNQGVFRLTKYKKSRDTLSVVHFTTKDGLLSNRVHDMAIDPVLGMAWFAHDVGITRYSRNDLRNAQKFMTSEAPAGVKAYPNPFRPKLGHRLVIDNIAEDSFVSIYNRGGSLVRSFRNAEVLGGRAEWDGLDKNGKLVAPGVYHYVVRKGSKKETGKIILVH